MTQLILDLGHRPAFGSADFLVAPCNEAAVAWLDRWPLWPAPALTLHGPAGCGKTHLAHVFRARTGGPLLAPSALSVAAVPDLAGDAAAVAVDEADRAEEEALLHLYNLMAERGGRLLLAAGAPPARWPTGLADLRSRLVGCPAVALAPPDDALLGAVLVKLFADRQLVVGEDLVAFLLRHLERSFDAARRAVAALDAAGLAARRRVTIPFARRVLGLDRGEER